MARQYSLRSFLRNAPNALLRRYLTDKGIGSDLGWDSLGETQVGPILEAIERAPAEVRVEVERSFRDVNEMATEGGIQTIIDEGRHPQHRIDLAETLGKMAGHYDRAFYAFLEYPRVFDVARRFNHADHLSGKSWRKRCDLPDVDPAIDLESRERLARAVSAYYRKTQGRGHACQVEHYSRGDQLYWFAYPEDYAGTSIEYDEADQFERRSQRPAFEVIFVYSSDEKSLDLFVRGSWRIVRDLQEIWGRTVLGVELGEPEKLGVVYQLNALKRREFPLAFHQGDGVQEIHVRKLRLKVMGKGNKRIVLEANVRDAPEGVYDLLDEVTGPGGISLELVDVTQVGFQFLFYAEGRRGTQTLNFDVTHPNSCSLKYDPKHEIAKKYLREWGIDVSGRTEPALAKS